MEHLKNIPINDFMVKDVMTLREDETLWAAYCRMKSNRIRHLPVVNHDGKLIGMFTDKDLNRAYAARETDAGWYYDKDELRALKPSRFMTSNPFSLTPEKTLKNAADLMIRNKFGSIPIVTDESGKLVGIVTLIDILRKISSLFE